jgi:hypothetical protein
MLGCLDQFLFGHDIALNRSLPSALTLKAFANSSLGLLQPQAQGILKNLLRNSERVATAVRAASRVATLSGLRKLTCPRR